MHRATIDSDKFAEALSKYLDPDQVNEIFNNLHLSEPGAGTAEPALTRAERALKMIVGHCSDVPFFKEGCVYDPDLKLALEEFIDTYVDLPELAPLKKSAVILPRGKVCRYHDVRDRKLPLEEWCEKLSRDEGNVYHIFETVIDCCFDDLIMYEIVAGMSQICELREGDIIGHSGYQRSDYIVKADGSLAIASTDDCEYTIIPGWFTATLDNPVQFFKEIAEKFSLPIELYADHPENPHGRTVYFKIKGDAVEICDA